MKTHAPNRNYWLIMVAVLLCMVGVGIAPANRGRWCGITRWND